MIVLDDNTTYKGINREARGKGRPGSVQIALANRIKDRWRSDNGRPTPV